MAKQKTKSADTGSKEREFVIPLRRRSRLVPRYRRTSKAVKTIKEYVVRHMKIYNRDLKKVKIDKYLNEFLWHRGIKNPPFKVKVKAIKNKEGIVNVELVEMPDKLKFKKARLDKRESKAKEIMEAKKSRMQKLKESAQSATNKGSTSPKEDKEEKTQEEKKEEKEKQASVVEAGKEMKKQQAKQAKHQTKQAKSKKPKHQKRVALQK